MIFEVPVLTPYLSSLWLHVVTPVKAGVARPLIEGLRNETVAQDERIRELVPVDLTPFDDAARSAFPRPSDAPAHTSGLIVRIHPVIEGELRSHRPPGT